MSSCPPRSSLSWPWPEEAERVASAGARFLIATSAHETLLEQYLLQRWGETKLSVVGIVDLVANPLAAMASRLSTPGLYGEAPAISAPEGSEPLLEALERAGWTSTMQGTEYFQRAQGCVALVPGLDAEQASGPRGPLVLRLVQPHDLHVEVRLGNPLVPVRLYELRLRPDLQGKQSYAFDLWDMSNPAEPRYSILDATAKLDITSRYLPDGAQIGAAYPWRYGDGRPYIPHVFYRVRTTDFWGGAWQLKALQRATYEASAKQIVANYAGDSASFGLTYLLGCHPRGLQVKGRRDGAAFHSLDLLPGANVLLEIEEGVTNASVVQVRPSADPRTFQDLAQDYQAQALANAGLKSADVTRQNAGANPTSAAALLISDADRRAAQRQLIPVNRASDLELFSKCAALLNNASLYPNAIPETGYSITYSVLPLSPDEESQARAAAVSERDGGLISDVELYRRLHPGTDREGAFRALVGRALDDQELQRRLAEAGVPMIKAHTIPEVAEAEPVKEQVKPIGDELVGDSQPADLVAEVPASNTALNGAQVQAAQGIVVDVAAGKLPRSTGVAMLIEFFNLPSDKAEKIMGEVGRGFTPAPEPTV